MVARVPWSGRFDGEGAVQVRADQSLDDPHAESVTLAGIEIVGDALAVVFDLQAGEIPEANGADLRSCRGRGPGSRERRRLRRAR